MAVGTANFYEVGAITFAEEGPRSDEADLTLTKDLIPRWPPSSLQ